MPATTTKAQRREGRERYEAMAKSHAGRNHNDYASAKLTPEDEIRSQIGECFLRDVFVAAGFEVRLLPINKNGQSNPHDIEVKGKASGRWHPIEVKTYRLDFRQPGEGRRLLEPVKQPYKPGVDIVQVDMDADNLRAGVAGWTTYKGFHDASFVSDGSRGISAGTRVMRSRSSLSAFESLLAKLAVS